MRSIPAAPSASLVSHRRWPWIVTSGGLTSWKSASKLVFVEGTITPIRLRTLMPGSSWPQEMLEGGQNYPLHQRRRVRHAGHRDQFTSRQLAHHARGLRPREHITLRAPHDHSRARQAPEHGPQCGPWRRAALDALLDVRGVHLPDPAAVWSRPKHAEGKLTLVV